MPSHSLFTATTMHWKPNLKSSWRGLAWSQSSCTVNLTKERQSLRSLEKHADVEYVFILLTPDAIMKELKAAGYDIKFWSQAAWADLARLSNLQRGSRSFETILQARPHPHQSRPGRSEDHAHSVIAALFLKVAAEAADDAESPVQF